jgi:acetyl esterase/lipase
VLEQAAAAAGVTPELRLVGDPGAWTGELELARAAGAPVVLVPGVLAGPRLVDTVAAVAGDPAVVWLDLFVVSGPRASYLQPDRISSIRGRGLAGLAWAFRSAVARSRWPVQLERYGTDPEHVGDLRLPPAGAGRVPVCVLLHGGHWRENWERDLMDELAVDLTGRGYATWNLGYRRVGPSGGGWPATFADVAAGIDHLASLADRHCLDVGRVALVGHSAGGQLGMWAATRGALAPNSPGASPAVRPAVVLSLAGVPDLAHSARLGIDQRAVVGMIGGSPAEFPERYAHASPAERLPLECPCLLVWGGRDSPDIVEENRLVRAAAKRSGRPLEVLELPEGDHFSVIDPKSASWAAIAERFCRMFPATGSPGPIPGN